MLLLQAAPSPPVTSTQGPPPPSATSPQTWNWHGLTAGDIAQSLALPLSLLVAYLTVRLTGREQRRGAILTELLGRLADLQERSDTLALDLSNHLIGHPSAALSQEDSHRQITLGFKAVQRRVEAMEALLPERHALELGNAYQKWWREATDTGYPVLDPAKAFKVTDARVVSSQRQHEEWDKHLSVLKVGCLRHEVRFWSVRRR